MAPVKEFSETGQKILKAPLFVKLENTIDSLNIPGDSEFDKGNLCS